MVFLEEARATRDRVGITVGGAVEDVLDLVLHQQAPRLHMYVHMYNNGMFREGAELRVVRNKLSAPTFS